MASHVEDMNNLAGELTRLSRVAADAAIKKSIANMFNRAATTAYTPFDTGELRKYRRTSMTGGEYVFGYTKDYAPHVEYGHRVVAGEKTRGYVEGRHFLRDNWDVQRPILLADIKREVKP